MAEEVRERLAALREAGARLRRRPAHQTLAALAAVMDRWCDPASDVRRALEAQLPAATGFTPETVREGLAQGLAGFTGNALLGLVERELGPVEALDSPLRHSISGFETTAVLLAGQIPMPTLLALVAPLVLRSPVLAKCGAEDPVTAPLVLRSLREVDEDLGRCAEALAFSSRDDAAVAALLEADCVVASGSDATMAAVAARVEPPRRFVPYGHRVSFAALGDDAVRGAGLDEAAAGLARDVASWDQLGCLSPIAVYVVSGDSAAADRVAEALASALVDAERRWPRGELDAGARARFADERAAAELRAADGRRVAVHAGDGFCVVREEDARARPAPLFRFCRVHPVGDPDALLDALRPTRGHLAAVGVAGFGDDTPRLARALADLGASRVCSPGQLQAPPLAWRHDNRGVLLPLARFADLDVGHR